MYCAQTWAVKKAQEKKLDVAEMRILGWISGVTKLDRISNEIIIIIIMAGMAVFNVAGYLIEERRRWPVNYRFPTRTMF